MENDHGYRESVEILEAALREVAVKFADHENQQVVFGDFALVVEGHTLDGTAVILRFGPRQMPPWRAIGLMQYALSEWTVPDEPHG